MSFMKIGPEKAITVFCDNTGAIFPSKNQESRLSKHLDIKAHYIRGYIEKGVIEIVYVKSNENVVDEFTKSCGKESVEMCNAYMSEV